MTNGSSPRDESFWRNSAWWSRVGQTSLGVWASNGVSMLATVVAARALGPEDYGSVVLALAIVFLVSTFLDVTLEEAVVYHGNQALAKGDISGLRRLLKTSLWLDLGVGVIVTGGLFLLAAPLADVASADRLDPTLVRLMVLSVLVMTVDSTTSAVLLLARRAHLRAWSMAATSAFRLVGVVVAVQFGGVEAVALSYVLGSAAGSCVLGALAWRIVRREWGAGVAAKAAPVSIWKVLRFGLHTSVTGSLYAAYGSLVPVILGRTAGPAAVGIFRVAMLPVMVANTLTGPLRMVLFPEQSKLAAEGRVEELRRSVAGYTLIGFAVGIVGAVVGWFAMPWLIPLIYSPQFDAAVGPARVLLVAAVFYLALSWTKTFFAAVGRPQLRTLLAATEFGVVAVALAVLGDQGAMGGAIAVTAGSVVVGVVWLFVARRVLKEESSVHPQEEPAVMV